MRRLVLLAVTLLILAAVVVPAGAVRFGQPDNGEHPHVGIIVFYNPDGSASHRCTGTMISARVMLTAAHCADLNGAARVWFGETAADNVGYPYSGGFTGTYYAHPQWTGSLTLPDTHDVGVVVLDVAPNLGTSPIAGAGYLDTLATRRGNQNVEFLVVGYGLQAVKPSTSALRNRLQATVQLVNLSSNLADGYNLHTTNAPGGGTGGGGTCFGDSGGAIFHEGNIVAVNSFVLNSNCAGASFGYRVDRAEVLSWIYSFVQQYG